MIFKKSRVLILLVALIILVQTGCEGVRQTASVFTQFSGTGVTISDRGNYFYAVLDFTCGVSHKKMGEEYARGLLKVIPNYEVIVDSYIAECLNNDQYKGCLDRVKDLKPQLPQEYADEIDGMSEVFSGKDENIRNDGRLSKEEFYLFNLFPDVARDTQCCFVSVFGGRSETNSCITGRNLDWFGGSKNQLPRIQGIVTLKGNSSTTYSIGYLGFMGIITGFNDSRNFAAILDSQSGAPYTSKGKRSYTWDLRLALEKEKTISDISGFMMDNAKNYTVNHIIALSDQKESKVLENNFSGVGSNGQSVRCALRDSESKLNNGIEWGFENAVGSVNSFMLYGNTDGYTGKELNTLRWRTMRSQLESKGPTVSFNEIKEVMQYNHGSPGAFSDSGDLYNKMTLQMIVFKPESLELEVFFRPKSNRVNPDKPVFEKIEVAGK